jgi:preprotein translocase subunit YajC
VENGAGTLVFLGLMVGVFYFMLIRPQKRRVDEHRRLVDSVDVGDEIVTIGGIFGTVRALRDDEFELEVAPGTVLRFVKSAIARRVTEDIEDDEDIDESEEIEASEEVEEEETA